MKAILFDVAGASCKDSGSQGEFSMSGTEETSDSTEKPQGRLRWRKLERQHSFSPVHHVLTDGQSELMHVQKDDSGLFFWYGQGVNTACACVDLATAKTQALAHYKEVSQAQPAAAPRRRPR